MFTNKKDSKMFGKDLDFIRIIIDDNDYFTKESFA